MRNLTGEPSKNMNRPFTEEEIQKGKVERTGKDLGKLSRLTLLSGM